MLKALPHNSVMCHVWFPVLQSRKGPGVRRARVHLLYCSLAELDEQPAQMQGLLLEACCKVS